MDKFEFVYELNRATNALNSYIDACIVERSGLTRAQCVALMLIERSPGITKAALGRKLNSSHVAVGRLVLILSKKGYASSTPSKQNRHTAHLQTTPLGKRMIQQVKLIFEQQSAELFSSVADEIDVAQLSSQLHIFTEILSSHR